jgi:hypothetical protein
LLVFQLAYSSGLQRELLLGMNLEGKWVDL